MKKGNFFLIVGLLALVIGAGYGVFYYRKLSDYRNAVAEIKIKEPNLSAIDDGKYIGEHNVGFIFAKVEVEVKNHQFRSIKTLTHTNDRGGDAESIPDKILDEQKIDVDAVSVATNSSKVIKKAVEKALKN